MRICQGLTCPAAMCPIAFSRSSPALSGRDPPAQPLPAKALSRDPKPSCDARRNFPAPLADQIEFSLSL